MSNVTSIFLPDDPPPKKRPRAGRVISWVMILLLAASVGLEGAAMWCQKDSVKRLRAYCEAHPQGPFPTANEVSEQLAGWPLRKEVTVGRRRMVVYRWPSLFRNHLVRGVLNAEDRVVALSEVLTEDDDFDIAIASAGKHGLVLTQPVAELTPQPPVRRPDLLAEVRQTFSRPRPSYPPGVVVFPVVDGDNRVLPAGAGLSVIANFSLICSPRKRTTLDPRHVRQVLVEATCWRGGTELAPRRMEACLAELGTGLYVVPRLETTKEGLRLQVQFRDKTATLRDKTFEHVLSPTELTKVPGLIALDVLSHVGVELRPEDRAWVAAPQIQGEADAIGLSEQLAGVPAEVRHKKNFDAFVNRNPECVAGWEVSLEGDMGIARTMLRPQSADSKVLLSSSVQRSLAIYPLVAGDPWAPFEGLLALAPSQRGDVRWYQALVNAAQELPDPQPAAGSMTPVTTFKAGRTGNDDLISEIFASWERDASDYPNFVGLGRTLVHWAWRARGTGFADTITAPGGRSYEERLERARRHLEHALELNPTGWQAHRELITVAMGLGLPFNYMEKHFKAAREICPGDQATYSRKHFYVQKKWFGTTEALLRFARECAESGEWSSGIPQMVPGVLAEAMDNSPNYAISYKCCRDPDFWAALERYYAGAQQQNDESLRSQALNLFAVMGAMGGHFTGVAEAFQRLDVERIEPAEPDVPGRGSPRVVTEYDVQTFGVPEFRYAQLRDRVLAATNDSSAGRIAAVRVALADARLDDAEQAIAAVTPANEDEVAEIERCRRALALGRRLYREGEIEISPQEALETFVEYERVACRGGLDRSRWWKVDGDKLTWGYPGFNHYHPERGYVAAYTAFFPVGLKHAVISGQIEGTGDMGRSDVVIHAQALRAMVTAAYSFKARTVRLAAKYQRPEIGQLPPGSCPFEFQCGPAADRLIPAPKVPWSCNVEDDLPSTFGFVMYPAGEQQGLSISRLKIELRR